MARQSSKPVDFNKSVRGDTTTLMSSGRAGQVVPAGYIPLLPGDSCSGAVAIDVQLREMPRPALNAVSANMQAWFVPKSAFPQFAGRDELRHAMTGATIKALGSADRAPPPYFNVLTGAERDIFKASALAKTLGLHFANYAINSDLIDAISLIWNFRAAAISSRIARRVYSQENLADACALRRAFWPSNQFGHVVPDYERALVVGSLDLDVIAGRLPVTGIGFEPTANVYGSKTVRETGNTASTTVANARWTGGQSDGNKVFIEATAAGFPEIMAEMAGQTIGATLADIDNARTAQAFGKLRTAYSGNDATGFDNDSSIVALLMQGIEVEPDEFKRPWLLDSKRVPVGFAQRFATDSANLEDSVTTGRASATLSLNVPTQDVGGIIVFTIEVLPERLHERMTDEFWHCTTFDHLPNALRDVQRVEPVDMVLKRRVDAMHTDPGGLYGHEPMNKKWDRNQTRLGGDYWQGTPGAAWTEKRSAIWYVDSVDPVLNESHYLAPVAFPHTVFAVTSGPAFDFVARHSVRIAGLTQIGDPLAENNNDYTAVTEAG